MEMRTERGRSVDMHSLATRHDLPGCTLMLTLDAAHVTLLAMPRDYPLTSSSQQDAPCSHGWHVTAGTPGLASDYQRSPERTWVLVWQGPSRPHPASWLPSHDPDTI